MSTLNICAVRPSHPCIRRMALERARSSGGTLSGCVCGMLYADNPHAKLAAAGRTAPSLRLTAICWQPETLLPQDILRTEDGAAYRLCGVAGSDGGVLTGTVEPVTAENS